MKDKDPVDKSKWGDGPWQGEPDRVEWTHAGLPCLALRGPVGAWCGYAAVLPGHPWHGKSYDDVDVEAHGGLTYANKCSGHICHVPKPGEPDDVFWFGFDCAHAGDYCPSYAHLLKRPSTYNHERAVKHNRFDVEIYRDLAYVRAETNRLAKQLAAVKA